MSRSPVQTLFMPPAAAEQGAASSDVWNKMTESWCVAATAVTPAACPRYRMPQHMKLNWAPKQVPDAVDAVTPPADQSEDTHTLLHSGAPADVQSHDVAVGGECYLPLDLLVHCFSYLSMEELLHCRSVSHSWSLATKEDDAWQHIWLHTHVVDRYRLTEPAGRVLLRILPSLKHVVNVDLSRCETLSNYALGYLATLSPDIQRLNLNHCSNITDASCRYISMLQHLHTLDLSYTQITDTALVYLKGLTSLEQLNLQGCRQITDNSLQIIGQHFVHLEDLTIGAEGEKLEDLITHQGLQHLSMLPSLYKLTVGCTVDNQGAYEVSRLTGITILDLAYISSDSLTAMEYIGCMHQLRKLSVGLADAAFYNLSALSHSLVELRQLRLITKVGVDDWTVESIARLPKLRSLRLSNCSQLTVEGLRTLLTTTSLKELLLCSNSIISFAQFQILSIYATFPPQFQMLQFDQVSSSGQSIKRAPAVDF